MRAGWLGFWVLPVALAAACSASDNGAASGVDSSTDGSDGGGGSDGSSPGPDGTVTSDSSSPGQDSSSGTDTGTPPADTGSSGGWDGSFGGGPLMCGSPASYVMNGGSCGTLRWSIKTGTDSAASSISLVPTLTTIADLIAIPAPGSTPFDTRVPPVETTTYALKDIRLIYVRLETDSDYHVVMSDGVNTMITEVPYPDCAQGSAWYCPITHARAQIDMHYPGLVAGQGQGTDQVVSAVGVGFWDQEHGQNGAAPNNVELHALLALCFGQGCTPGQ